MRTAKRVTVSAMMTALGTVLLTAGALFDVIDLSACALASLLVVFIYIEVGVPYAWLVWLATSLLSFVFFPAKTVWLVYLLVFGLYPIIKGLIQRLPRLIWIPLKLVYANIMFVVCIFLMPRIFGIPFIDTELLWVYILMYAALNAMFVLYDIFINVMVGFYYRRLRHRFSQFLG